MALTLGRVAGQAGLSMFYLPTRDQTGSLNNIRVVKLKNKLGTRQLPTAELMLEGTEAQLVGEPGRGVASISSMLTISRIHNAVMSISSMRRMVGIALQC